MRFSKRELELQEQQSLDQYKALVLKEAKRRITDDGLATLCVTHLRHIKNKDNFEQDVQTIVGDTHFYQ